MATAKHVMKRILMMLAGYLVALLVGLVAVVAIYAALSSLPNAPAYFDVMSVSPIAVLVVPPLGMFIYFLTIVVTGLQTLIFALIAESFSLRNVLLHMLDAPSGPHLRIALEMLGGIALVAAVERVGALLQNDMDQEVRILACGALGEMDGPIACEFLRPKVRRRFRVRSACGRICC